MATIAIQKQRVQQMNEEKKKNKTPSITRTYAILEAIYIILGVLSINVFIMTFIGVPFVIISIGLAAKYKHSAAIISGIFGQLIRPSALLSYYMMSFGGTFTELGELVLILGAFIGLLLFMLETFVIYPLLFIYRKEEKIIQPEIMTREQAIAYIKEISNYENSILLNDISKNTDWRGEELTSLIENLIFNGELTAEIREDRLVINRDAFLALSEASEEVTTEVDEYRSLEDEIGGVEVNTAPKEILPIKDKKGKTMKNVVSFDDIEKVLSPRELKELQQTEAEMGIEEMQINCIVHKGPVEGINVYICPKCKTFYCVRCAKAVKKSGEKCWTCKSELTL